MNICIVGAGAVGGYYGAKLARSGSEVTFVARGQHAQAMKEGGLSIKSPLGDFCIKQFRVVSSLEEVVYADLIILSVKLWSLEELVPSLIRLVSQGSYVLALQNGVQKDQILGKSLPSSQLIGGVSYINSTISRSGEILHYSPGESIAFGAYHVTPESSALVEQFQHACQNAGVEVRVVPDIATVIWNKFIFLVALSGTTTVVQQPVGVLRTNPRTRLLFIETMQEVITLAKTLGVPLSEDCLEQHVLSVDRMPFDNTSSMFRDRLAGNRLELPWLSGWVASRSKELGLLATRNQNIADILDPYVLGMPS